jgi:hypothetical protein
MRGGIEMTNIERLLRNVKVFIEAGVLDEEFAVFVEENPELDSLSELNQIMEDEISYWEE